ncbi:hypothetical protein OC835_002624 [Tilletia horrida]|nr:hypothetical protein OC835_002624 [Tilletia horrida]
MAACMHSPISTSSSPAHAHAHHAHHHWIPAGAHPATKRLRSDPPPSNTGTTSAPASSPSLDAIGSTSGGLALPLPSPPASRLALSGVPTQAAPSQGSHMGDGHESSGSIHAASIPFPQRAASPSLRPGVAATSMLVSPARSQASSCTASSQRTAPSSVFDSPKAISLTSSPSHHSSLAGSSRHHFGQVLGHHRSERSSSSAASVSSSLYSSAYSQGPDYDDDGTEAVTPSTLELNLGSLVPSQNEAGIASRIAPGITPAFLVISVINHILFVRGALDMPVKLEPLLPSSDTMADAPRLRAQSLGSSRNVGGAKGKGRQNKLVDSLKQLHVNLVDAINAIYRDPSSNMRSSSAVGASTCDALLSVLLFFGPSPLLPKEKLHIVVRLTGISRGRSPVLTPAMVQPLDGQETRQISKLMTTLQRKLLRFVVSEDGLQPDAFSRKLANRVHVLLNVRYTSETLIASEDLDDRPAQSGAEAQTPASTNDEDQGITAVPRGWSFRRNVRIAPEVLRLQDRLCAPPPQPALPALLSVEELGSVDPVGAATQWVDGATHLRSRSSSPFSRSEPDECHTSRSGSGSGSSRFGSASPSVHAIPEDLLLPTPPLVLSEDGLQAGAGSSPAAATEHTMEPPFSQSQSAHSQLSNSIGSSTTTALPFAPSPLRQDRGSMTAESLLDGGGQGSDDGNAPAAAGEGEGEGELGGNMQHRLLRRTTAEPKSRLRGGFVLLRKTTSSTFPLPSGSSSRRGPRSSAASSLSLSLSAFGSDTGGTGHGEEAEDELGHTRPHAHLRHASSGSGCGRVEADETTLGARRSNIPSLLPASGVQAKWSGLKSGSLGGGAGRKRVPVTSLVLDLRSRPSDAVAHGQEVTVPGHSGMLFGAGKTDEARGEREEEEAQWWICDTVLPLGR